ncbi:hypothetical protein DMUE_6419, partial [Dictyocoela muelleri]
NEVLYKKSADGIAFRCYKKQCSNFQKYISIRKYSFFQDYNIELRKIMTSIYKWFSNTNQIDVQRELDISKKTVQKIYKNLRIRTKIFFEENSYRLGGEGIICQIDESMFKYKQKYFVGRSPVRNRWVFGIVDTSEKPGRYFVTSVGNRSALTLLPIINQICRPGSIIWSDEWRGYSN